MAGHRERKLSNCCVFFFTPSVFFSVHAFYWQIYERNRGCRGCIRVHIYIYLYIHNIYFPKRHFACSGDPETLFLRNDLLNNGNLYGGEIRVHVYICGTRAECNIFSLQEGYVQWPNGTRDQETPPPWDNGGKRRHLHGAITIILRLYYISLLLLLFIIFFFLHDKGLEDF